MKGEILRATLSLAAALLALAASAAGAKAPPPDYLKSAVIYQMALRTFTPAGTLAAATEKLGHVRASGASVVYLTPFVEMDRDMDRRGWSPRQIASGFDSPKNPYRLSNYDRIDPEYGTDEDFRRFNDRVHALGMRTFMDLVYLHCGPNNVLKDKFPDAFQKNADGTVRMTQWRFPYVNFASKGVRKYLIDSMCHWIRLGCDGFRCDVGDEVPIDFWVEAVTACRKLKPDLVMINEGVKPEWLEKAFDACYAWPWSYKLRHWANPKGHGGWDGLEPTLAGRMDAIRAYEAKVPAKSLMLSFLDNHDTAADDGTNRFDRVLPVAAGNALSTLNFLRRGIPLVFNGNEFADNALSSFFGPVGHPDRPKRIVDWTRADSPEGRGRFSLLRKLARLRRERVFAEGDMRWAPEGEGTGVVSFVRCGPHEGVLVAANLTTNAVTVDYRCFARFLEGVPPILAEGVRREGFLVSFDPWGYAALPIEGGKRPVPRPVLAERLRDERMDVYGLIHFGLNTYTDREWGYGDEDPAMFDPKKFDADKIAAAAKSGGLGGIILVAKHHDGFCLWPTATTDHNIRKSPFRGGKGDLVKEFETACRRADLRFGVYISPWDRHDAKYATPDYVARYHRQIRELLGGGYGEIFEMWFDGANGGDGWYGGAKEKRTITADYYRFDEIFRFVRELQPKVCIFNERDSADFRWPGNEEGILEPDCRATVPHHDPARYRDYMNWCADGTHEGTVFHPPEADFPIRRGWFYHAANDGKSKSGEYLMKSYLRTVGNGGTMNLGLSPNRDGELTDEDVASLRRFGELRRIFFAKDAKDGEPFNVVVMREDVSCGERVDAWRLVADGRTLLEGRSIGSKRICALETPVRGRTCELKVLQCADGAPSVSLKRHFVDPALLGKVLRATCSGGETDTAKWMQGFRGISTGK